MKYLFATMLSLSIAACAYRPSSWANAVVEKSRCGMTVHQAEKIAGRELSRMSGRTPRGTHVARKGFSAVWFDFRDEKLVAVQPAWTAGLALDRDGQRKALCE